MLQKHHITNLIINELHNIVNNQTAVTSTDPEKVESGGANTIKYQTRPGGGNYCFGITYKARTWEGRRFRLSKSAPE